MDRIQPYSGQHLPVPDHAMPAPAGVRYQAHQTHFTSHQHDSNLGKSPADYVRAVKKRIWLALAVAVPLGALTTIITLRLPAVYQAKATIMIEPPSHNPQLLGLLPSDFNATDPESKARYLPNQLGYLRSKELADLVLAQPGIVAPNVGDPAQELANSVGTRHTPQTNRVDVTMDGPDPYRVKKTLETWLQVFRTQATSEYNKQIEDIKGVAERGHRELTLKLRDVDTRIQQALLGSSTIGPGGVSLTERQYESANMLLMQKQMQLDNIRREARLAQLFPTYKQGGHGAEGEHDGLIESYEEKLRQLLMRRTTNARLIRSDKYASDASTRSTDAQIAGIKAQIEKLRGPRELRSDDPYDFLVKTAEQEVQSMEDRHKALLNQYQSTAPEEQKFRGLMEERADLKASIGRMDARLSMFQLLSSTENVLIRIPNSVAEPLSPIKPNRPVYIVAGILLGLICGIALVCGLEHFDQSVKVPEQLTNGLSLPLFGVIPRIRRSANVQRGGHLWTPGIPGSLEADAYRNLRASLVGLNGPNGPMVTILVTSAKAGEGKSTTALNLAATCARSGERTLLVDVDLRRPSLDPVFPDDDGLKLGLVDVLRDDLPWSQALIRTDIPNLDFLPTGDTTAIPVEILGTREMRQLLASLAQSHYDRVILDGPAILGLADCRMLGQMVDGALLVVRAGAIELQPLRRAKTMLEQSRVPIAGVVFNGLADDLENWSSYGPDPNIVPSSSMSLTARNNETAPAAVEV